VLSATQDCLALAHVQFETMHPFLDGNGRLSWLLIVLMLIEVGVLQQPVRRRLGRRARLCSGTEQISSHLPTRPWSAICEGPAQGASTSSTASSTRCSMKSGS
jgi:hypothetical protein